ncbi:hypothetical protein L6R50_05160 [Myxococcota bacterium]|nr:hypothetical protein [Myxococcota bacterium]
MTFFDPTESFADPADSQTLLALLACFAPAEEVPEVDDGGAADLRELDCVAYLEAMGEGAPRLDFAPARA